MKFKADLTGDSIYYTCLHGLPVWASTLQRVKIMPDGRAGEAEIVYRSLFSIFDDFDIADDGFVIADLKSPSAVQVVKQEGELFEKGDILITEKGRHCVSWLKPGDQWRQWLVGASAHP